MSAPVLASVFTAAADRLAANGHHVGDFVQPSALQVPDAQLPMAERELSVAAAIQLVATGDPLRDDVLSRRALVELANHVAEVDVREGDLFDAYNQLAAWEELVPDGAVLATLRDLAEGLVSA